MLVQTPDAQVAHDLVILIGRRDESPAGNLFGRVPCCAVDAQEVAAAKSRGKHRRLMDLRMDTGARKGEGASVKKPS